MTIVFIIYIAVLLVITLVTPFFCPFFRARRLINFTRLDEWTSITLDEETQPVAKAEPVSIVIVEHDSAFRLEQILPKYLSQEYDADYQIVVVIDENDSESENVLKRIGDDPHLYYTKLPVSSRYLSRKKLGITLGMRAAKYDWVIVTDVHSMPTSDQWLQHFTKHCTEDKNLVLGMTPYEDDAPVYYRFCHLRTMLYYLCMADKGMAFSTNQSMVAIRKSEFFAQKGFSGNLEYTRAEFEFLVNKFAEEGRTALAIEPEAWLQQFNPNRKRWMGRQLFSFDAMKGLQRRGWFKFWSYLDNDLIHIYNVLTLGMMAFGAWCIYDYNNTDCLGTVMNTEEVLGYICIIYAAVVWIISFIERFFIYRPILRAFTTINPAVAIILEWTMSLRNIALAIRYRFADKNDFITHKL